MAGPVLDNHQREALRTGECTSLRCHTKCEAYVPNGWADGFKICVCGHTQWVHQEVRTEQ